MRNWQDQTDLTLQRARLQGQATAWLALVERSSPLIFSIPLPCNLIIAEAEQVLQSVFQALYECLQNLPETLELAPWLILVMYREVQRARRRWRRSADPADAPSIAEPPPAPLLTGSGRIDVRMFDSKEIPLVKDSPQSRELTRGALNANNPANHTLIVSDGAEALDDVFRCGIHADRDPRDPSALAVLVENAAMCE